MPLICREEEKQTAIALNTLAREQSIRKLLADIAADLTVCELEGLDCMEYITRLECEIVGIRKAIENQRQRRGAIQDQDRKKSRSDWTSQWKRHSRRSGRDDQGKTGVVLLDRFEDSGNTDGDP